MCQKHGISDQRNHQFFIKGQVLKQKIRPGCCRGPVADVSRRVGHHATPADLVVKRVVHVVMPPQVNAGHPLTLLARSYLRKTDATSVDKVLALVASQISELDK